MTKKVELEPGLTIEQMYTPTGRPIGLIINFEDQSIAISPKGVVALTEYLEHLVA